MKQLTKSAVPVFALFILVALSSCSEKKKLEKNPLIQNILTSVSVSQIEKDISNLVALKTRFTHEKQLKAAEYLYNELSRSIKNTAFHEYEFWGVKWKNVIGTIPGQTNPEQIVIVCAHLDSKSEKRLVYAPGADDDASGCAAILELARVLSGHSFEKTLKFIFFSREETGQQGSKAYLKSIDRNKENIFAVLNLDMIAFGSEEEDIDLVTRPTHRWLAEEIYGLSNLYGFRAKKLVEEGCH